MEIALLEYLAMETGCMYISDLKYQKSKTNISMIIRKIPVELYSLREWNDAVKYLTGHEEFLSAEKARDYIIHNPA